MPFDQFVYKNLMSGYTERLPDCMMNYQGNVFYIKAILTLRREYGNSQIDPSTSHYVYIDIDYYMAWDRGPYNEDTMGWMTCLEDEAALKGQPHNSNGQRLERHSYKPIPVPRTNKFGKTFKDYNVDVNDPLTKELIENETDWWAIGKDVESILGEVIDQTAELKKKGLSEEDINKEIRRILERKEKKAENITRILKKIKESKGIRDAYRVTSQEIKAAGRAVATNPTKAGSYLRYAKAANFLKFLGLAAYAVDGVMVYMDYLEYEKSGSIEAKHQFQNSMGTFMCSAVIGLTAFVPIVGSVVALLDGILVATTGKGLGQRMWEFTSAIIEEKAVPAMSQGVRNMFSDGMGGNYIDHFGIPIP